MPEGIPVGPQELELTWDPKTGVATGERLGEPVTVEQVIHACGYRMGEVRIRTDSVETKAWPTSMKLQKRDEGGAVIDTVPIQIWNHYTRVCFDPIREEVVSRVARDALLREIQEDLRYFPVPHAEALASTLEDVVVELDVFDAHFQLLAWGPETGEDYDLEIATARFSESIQTLVGRALRLGHPIRYWLLPVGQDLFHTDINIDGRVAATTAGTPQDVDTRWQKAARRVRRLLTRLIRELLAYAPVKIPIIPGNHDQERAWWMGEILDATFGDDPRVEIDNRPVSRKYVRIGNSMIGFAHGKDEKPKDLRDYMTQEAPEAWARTRFREWHVGHLHHEKVWDERGVVIRQMPSIAGTDFWHNRKGYVHAMKGARAIVWSFTDGPLATLQHNYPATQEQLQRTGPMIELDQDDPPG